MKQETLEEVAEKYANESFVPMRNSDGEILRIPSGQTVPCGFTKHKKVAIKHFTNGYKLAIERSYSKEDMIDFAYNYTEERKNKGARALTPELLIKNYEKK